MKNLFTLSTFALLFIIAGCKKNDTKPEPEKPKPVKGKLLRIDTQGSGYYHFYITEYTPNYEDAVYHLDTALEKTSFTFEYHPHVGNIVYTGLGWKSTQPPPGIHLYYNGIEDANFETSTNDVNPPFNYRRQIHYTVPAN